MKYLSNNPLQGKMPLLLAVFLIAGVLNVQCSANDFQNVKTDRTNREVPVQNNQSDSTNAAQNDQYVGMWVTKDGHIRQELLPNGRYDEARGDKKSAYQGRYKITGNHIDYWDDTGFTADGEFRDGVLYHGGYVFYRK